MIKRIVTEADLEPHGWVCESCKRSFGVGATANGRMISRSIAGDWRCDSCEADTRPIIEAGMAGFVRNLTTNNVAHPAQHQLAVLKYLTGVRVP